MRIVSGAFRGRRLFVPEGIRPTTGRLREALFSMLDVQGTCFLELFAGSGAVALEALSRGAAQVHLVERNSGCARTIRRNLKEFGVVNRAHLYVGSVQSLVATLPRDCDLVFADPPYGDPVLRSLHGMAGALLKEGGSLILEFASRELPPELPAGWERLTSRRYGASAIVVDRLES